MAIQYLGSSPIDFNEYSCDKCGKAFSYRSEDEDGKPTYEDPKFCPACGKGE